MKKYLAVCIYCLLGLTACDHSYDLKGVENTIHSEVLKEFAGIASLEAIYLVSYMHFRKNLIRSDDIYVQKDRVSIDYGFRIDESAIRVVAEGKRKILQVRLKKGEKLATNRISIKKPEVTHDGYRPPEDVDAAMNKEIEEIEKKYEERNLKTAEENIKNFFKILAAKYGLELDFKVEA